MPEKRPGEDLENGQQKRPRSAAGLPANGASALAGKPDLQQKIAEARARAEAIKARLAGGAAVQAPSSSPSPAPAAPETGMSKIEAMRARVAAATAKASQTAKERTASPAVSMPPFQPPPDTFEGPNRARGGLNVGLHPALLADSGAGSGAKGKKAMAPKFATTMANRRDQEKDKERKQLDLSGPSIEDLKKNPYFDASLQAGVGKSSMHSRELIFNQKGKYIAQGNALRRQAQLEAMKKRIAEQARKAGLDEDNERSFLVPAPPDVEWWDEGLLEKKSYEDLDSPGAVTIDTPDSIITFYVQHPVLIEPPQEKNMPAPKPMYLTKTEQAKLRRQRRMADHKEQQAKIRLGLEEHPAPKVKKANMMRVLGEQAVKDPTAVEAMVNRQIAERAAQHEEANQSRKLTKEEKLEKLAKNQAEDAAKGIICSVFKINHLFNSQHRFKIDANAKQNALTGITLMHPKFSLVIVEGGIHSIAKFRKLMLNRIKWTENVLPASAHEKQKEIEQPWLQAANADGELKDSSSNKCQLVFEGDERQRGFRKWMGLKICETDGDAKEVLMRAKLEHMWVKAKGMA